MTNKAKPKHNAPTARQDFFMRLGVLGELLAFLWKRKLYWMLPLVITLKKDFCLLAITLSTNIQYMPLTAIL